MTFCPAEHTALSRSLSRLMSRPSRSNDRLLGRCVPLDCPDRRPLFGLFMAGDDILDAIDRTATMGARSTLSRWMRENHDALAMRLAVRRADWTVLAAVFEKAGLTDGEGKTATAETARAGWLRPWTAGAEPLNIAKFDGCRGYRPKMDRYWVVGALLRLSAGLLLAARCFRRTLGPA
jgi:hypothetical protein